MDDTGNQPLSEEEQQLLAKCETDIRHGFERMCESFIVICDNDLWRGTHPSFPAYIKEALNISQSQASHLISALDVLNDLDDFDQKPKNESQCRPLGPLNTDERQEVWSSVVESDDKPTTALIQEKVADLKGDDDQPEDEPHESPDPESEVISVFTSAVNALEFVCRSVDQLNVRERAEEIQTFVDHSRTQLDQIETSLLPIRVEVTQ